MSRADRTQERLLGIHVVMEALQAGHRRIERVLIQRGHRNRQVNQIAGLARDRDIPVGLESRAALDRLAGGSPHQGVLALADPIRHGSEEEVLERAGNEPPFLLVLDGIEDPRNLGAILRTAAAAGVHGVFLPERGSVGLTPAALRAASGAAEHVPLVRTGNVASLLGRLRDRGLWGGGLDPSGKPLWGGFDLALPLALVVGREGRGLRRLVRGRCEVVLGIPMPGGGGSLNLSVAAAVALFEVVRRRIRGG